MSENICEQCGTRNEADAQFCVQCQAYLPWSDETAESAADHGAPGPATVPETAFVPGPPTPPALPAVPDRTTGPAPADRDSTPDQADPVRVSVEPTSIEVAPGGERSGIEVVVYNMSQIVDAYQIIAVDPPDWLQAESAEVRLLPGTSESTMVDVGVAPGVLAPAGSYPLRVRVQSVAHPEIVVEYVVTVGVLQTTRPLTLRLEPTVIRAVDAAAARIQVTVDNTAGNRPRQVRLAGRDPESLLRFSFSPASVEVPAGGVAVVAVSVVGPAPAPGESTTRQLTIAATDDPQVQATASFIQTGSVEAPLTVRLEPTLLRVTDGESGVLDISVDNRQGTRTRRVFFAGRDPERFLHFTFSPPSIDVLPDEIGHARVRVVGPAPPPGQEAARGLTIIASADDVADLESPATFVQSTSAIVPDPPLTVRLDPSVVRVRDTAVGQLEVVVDNRSGKRTRRATLSGRDPERLVRFGFSPPWVEVPPGQNVRVMVRLEAPLPAPGEAATRQVAVIAADETTEAEAGGTFVQETSAAPVETPVALKLDPSLIRLRDSTSARFGVTVDNRQGIRVRRVTLAGLDPERAMGFTFNPPVVQVGQGQIAHAEGRLDVALPEPGSEVTRQFSVSASDGIKEVETAGTVVQSASPPLPDQPVAVRLDPHLLRVRDSSGGRTLVVVDNRRGSRARYLQFSGNDPERAVRFVFNPPVVEVGPGGTATSQVSVQAPRPDGGDEISRPYTVVVSDGVAEVEASGTLVQESTDRRPLWRVLLTLLGAGMMITGSFLVWDGRIRLTGIDWGLPELDDVSEKVLPGQLFPDLPNRLDPFVSAGAVIILLAVVAMVGLIGRKGRLTRFAALLAAVALVVFMIAVRTQVDAGAPGPGAFLVIGGCVVAFVGGLFARPRKS